jgi:hypothetical protein
MSFQELPAGAPANNSFWLEDWPASVAKGTISRSQCLKPAHAILGLLKLKRAGRLGLNRNLPGD